MGRGIPGSRRHRRLGVMGAVMAMTVASLALLASGVGTSTAGGRSGALCGVPVVPLAQAVRSMDASELSEAARLARASIHRYRSTIAGDPTAWLDDCGQTLIVDPASPERRVRSSRDGVPEDFPVAPAPLAQTFELHSKPGSDRTLFLDFRTQWMSLDGRQVAEATAGALRYEGWSLDGQPDAFNDDERLIIQMIWLRVAEDFSTWDVDVTTELPAEATLVRDSPTDTVYGQSAIFVIDGPTVEECDCRGFAPLGNFESLGPKTPAFVVQAQPFPPESRFNNWRSSHVTRLASTASHEIGHTLSLMHDGVTVPWGTFEYDGGRKPWAPIMGSPDWGLGQWSNGDYSGSTNTEDDLAIIGRSLPTEADEDADASTARTLKPGSTQTGLINSARDVDYFKLTHPGGPLTIAARPLPWGANVDIEMAIRRAGAQADAWIVDPVAKQRDYSTSVSGLSAVWTSAQAPAGEYEISVRGVGAATESARGTEPYSSYGSVGQYSIIVERFESPLTLPVFDVVVTVPGARQVAFTPVGGRPPFTWAIVSAPPDLPMDVDLLGRYGFAPPGTGEWKATIAARDLDGRVVQADVSIFAYESMSVPGPVTLRAVARKKFAYVMVANHAHRAVSWKLSDGSLPPGVRLSSDGRLRGAAARPGTWTATLLATDAAGRQADVTVSITVRKAA